MSQFVCSFVFNTLQDLLVFIKRYYLVSFLVILFYPLLTTNNIIFKTILHFLFNSHLCLLISSLNPFSICFIIMIAGSDLKLYGLCEFPIYNNGCIFAFGIFCNKCPSSVKDVLSNEFLN